ncbi:MAG: hypothetical protein ABSH27_08190 [Solirubrobacteraceae bacterium]|jgi:hypothetical protein
MDTCTYERPGRSGHTGAEAAVAVAERGLDSWRSAKAAWLDSFELFVAQEAAAAPSAAEGMQRTR